MHRATHTGRRPTTHTGPSSESCPVPKFFIFRFYHQQSLFFTSLITTLQRPCPMNKSTCAPCFHTSFSASSSYHLPLQANFFINQLTSFLFTLFVSISNSRSAQITKNFSLASKTNLNTKNSYSTLHSIFAPISLIPINFFFHCYTLPYYFSHPPSQHRFELRNHQFQRVA